MKDRVIATDIARRFSIGDFFEDLTIHVLGGKPMPEEQEIDLEHPELDSTIEVKASGSTDSPLIYQGQLERHLDERGFPYEHCLYAIWTYHNTRHLRIGKMGLTKMYQLAAELARRTRSLFVLDARVLEAVLLKRGTTGLWRDGDYRAAHLRINTTWLRCLSAGPAETLLGLGLNPRTFHIQQGAVQTVFGRLPVVFKFTVVLPHNAAKYTWPVHQNKPHLLSGEKRKEHRIA